MSYTIDDLKTLMARLRDPQTGCPWDTKQTFRTIVPHTLEEAHEVADTIEREDYGHLKEELGDLLFQVIFYAQMGQEQELFGFDDIVDTLVRKLLRRHPHVFPEGTLKVGLIRITGPQTSGSLPAGSASRLRSEREKEKPRIRSRPAVWRISLHRFRPSPGLTSYSGARPGMASTGRISARCSTSWRRKSGSYGKPGPMPSKIRPLGMRWKMSWET